MKSLTTLLSVLFLASGCTAEIIGTGGDGEARPQQAVAANDSNTGVGEIGKPPEQQSPPALAASGVPVDIDGLFHTPASATVTDDQLFGVWALVSSPGSNDETERRMRFSANELVIAERCKADGVIVYVSVQVRASNEHVTILESKQEDRTPYRPPYGKCTMSVGTVVQEWSACDQAGSSSICYRLVTDKLSFNNTSGSWLKLSD